MKDKKLSVLIIEDELILQDVYKLIIASAGHTVFTANNGQEGLKILQKTTPDVILLDIFMPILDGREFLRNFDKAKYPKTTIIVYSNLSDSIVQQELIDLGADKFILKASMTPNDLLKILAGYIK